MVCGHPSEVKPVSCSRNSPLYALYHRHHKIHHWTVFSAFLVRYTLTHQFFIMILILSSTVCLDPPIGPFLEGFRTKFCTHSSSLQACYMSSSSNHFILINLTVLFQYQYKLCSSSLCIFLRSTLTLCRSEYLLQHSVRKHRQPVFLQFERPIFTPLIRGCIQKFPDWPRGVRTVNDTALCH
jgi:hypothetical protein